MSTEKVIYQYYFITVTLLKILFSDVEEQEGFDGGEKIPMNEQEGSRIWRSFEWNDNTIYAYLLGKHIS